MLTPSPDIIQLLQALSPCFTKPTFNKVLALLYGAILSPGKRTVTAALRVLGLEHEPNFGKYHRVLNQAVWSPLVLSRVLLHLLISTFVVPGEGLVFLVDETLERRSGKQIVYKGWFRDAVRSVGNKVAVSLGIRWCVICLLVRVPWATRPWALPFLCVPVLSEKTCQRLHKPHRSGIAWTIWLIEKLRAWYPESEVTLVGDGGYAAVELVAACQRLRIRLISRLRLDAQLYAFVGEQPKSKRGKKPQKGARLPSLATLLTDPKTIWCHTQVAWYGGNAKPIGYRSGVCLWYTSGQPPVPLRWVLVRYEETNPKTGKVTVKGAVFFCQSHGQRSRLLLCGNERLCRSHPRRLCGAVEHRSHLRGSTGASGLGDATALVPSRYRAHNPLSVGTVQSGSADGASVAPDRTAAATERLVSQRRSDL